MKPPRRLRLPFRRARPRRERRRRFRITREGKVFGMVTIGVGVAAVNTGNNLLYLVLGLMLSLLLLSGVLSDLVLFWVSVERALPRSVFAGSEAPIEVRVRNRKRFLPSLSIEVVDVATGEDDPHPAYFVRVAPRAEERAIQRRRPARRGILRHRGFRLQTRYPFGLIEKVRWVEVEDEMLVYPELFPVAFPTSFFGQSGEDQASKGRGRGPEVVGVRDYSVGDAARDIHWLRSASRGEIVVRERELPSRQLLVILFDDASATSAAGGEGDEENGDPVFERLVSEVASLAREALSRGIAVEVRSRSGRSPRVDPDHPADPLFRYLALIAPAEPGRPMSEAPTEGAVVRVARPPAPRGTSGERAA